MVVRHKKSIVVGPVQIFLKAAQFIFRQLPLWFIFRLPARDIIRCGGAFRCEGAFRTDGIFLCAEAVQCVGVTTCICAACRQPQHSGQEHHSQHASVPSGGNSPLINQFHKTSTSSLPDSAHQSRSSDKASFSFWSSIWPPCQNISRALVYISFWALWISMQ